MSEEKGKLFLELADPDDDGYSYPISTSRFVGRYESLQLGNGGGWCRSDGSGWLGRYYEIERHREGREIVAVELCGLKNPDVRPPGR